MLMGPPIGHAPRPVAAQNSLFFRNGGQSWAGKCIGANFREEATIGMGLLWLLISLFWVHTSWCVGQLFASNKKKTTQRWINQITRDGCRVIMALGRCEEINSAYVTNWLSPP